MTRMISTKILDIMSTAMMLTMKSMEIGILTWIMRGMNYLVLATMDVFITWLGIMITVYFIYICKPKYLTIRYIEENFRDI